MTILERPVADAGIHETGITMDGAQSHSMDPAIQTLDGDHLTEGAKNKIKINAVQTEEAQHKNKSRDASQLFTLGDRSIIGK